jgi:hypothetical protein
MEGIVPSSQVRVYGLIRARSSVFGCAPSKKGIPPQPSSKCLARDPLDERGPGQDRSSFLLFAPRAGELVRALNWS